MLGIGRVRIVEERDFMKVLDWHPDLGALVVCEGREPLVSVDRGLVNKLIADRGAVIFRGFETNTEIFVQFSDVFTKSHTRHIYPSLRKAISHGGTVADVLAGNGEIELHGEMYYRPGDRPDLLWLHCLKPAQIGGATTVCDGIPMWNALSESSRKRFTDQRLMYVHTMGPTVWNIMTKTENIDEALELVKTWEKVRNAKILPQNRLYLEYIIPAFFKTKFSNQIAFINSVRNTMQYYGKTTDFELKVYFEDGSEISKGILDEIYKVSSKLIKPVDWHAGDILVVDNHRMLHGRQAFEGEREIQTRFSKAA